MRPSGKEGKSQQSAEIRKIFTDTATRFPRDFAKQAQHIVAAHRPAGLPEKFQPLNMSLSDWDRIQRERQRQRQEAEARERAQQQQAEQQRLAREREAQTSDEQRKRNEVTEGQKSVQKLENEMRSTPLPQIAESIKQQWQAQSPNVSVTLTWVREPEVDIWSDEIRDDSRVGIKLSYSHEEFVSYEGSGHYEGEGYVTDYEGFTGVSTLPKVLVIGIGMLTNYDFLSTEMVSSAKYNERVRCYFVKTNKGGNAPGVTSQVRPASNPVGIPVNYPNSLQKFYELLDDRVNDLAPSKVIPEANLRIQASGIKAHEEPKKGFWKRLIGG